ncbi:hypothetical protein [Planctopirus limnophila]|uniref:hypothetical protein n=1 Tax=Planctopirus limnophila TaxID=120 RepID=UPI0011D0B5B4|nr:hypothetical protein [Planctopirus limnophila]
MSAIDAWTWRHTPQRSARRLSYRAVEYLCGIPQQDPDDRQQASLRVINPLAGTLSAISSQRESVELLPDGS